MPLPTPKLDDRGFAELMADALATIEATAPEWTDRSPGDPGVTLLEAFAFLTEAMLYRLNRVPAKLYVTLLNLAGAQLRPPSAAAATLLFTRSGEGDAAIEIPAGTRVAAGDGTVEFIVGRTVTLKKGAATVEAPALHAAAVEGELLGVSSGLPGQALRVRQPPIIAPSGDGLDLVVAVEAGAGEAANGLSTVGYGGKTFHVWTEVASFADAAAGDRVYRVDRATGVIQLPPAGAGAIPPSRREVRAWYRRGGGRAGNVAAGALKTLKGFEAPLEVSNPARAAGGTDPETLEEGLARGPLALSSMHCAVTARDFERVALSVGGIARAKAHAQAQAWRHADPGVVEILLIPQIDVSSLEAGAVTASVIIEHRRPELMDRVVKAVDARRPLTVRTRLAWAWVRPVDVIVRVVVGPEVDRAAVERQVRRRINGVLSPLRDRAFGRELRASDLYEAILAEPGVRYADRLQFRIGESPQKDVVDLVRDPHQPQTFFAVATTSVHRSLDDGDSWSTVYIEPDEKPRVLRRHPGRAGLAALVVDRAGGASVHITRDCGESWTRNVAAFNHEVFDATWIERDGAPMLLLATSEGLRQFAPNGSAGPSAVIVDKAIDGKGYYAVTSATSPSGVISVAAAARAEGGVYLSASGGVSETFHPVGLKETDIRTLAVQTFNARDYLWAAATAEAGAQGEGAFRLELRASGEDDPDGFKPFNIGWQGGSCEGLSFAGQWVFGGSNRGGVLALDVTAASPAWRSAPLDAGLPIRDKERLLHTVTSVAAALQPAGPPIVFSGGPMGVHRSLDGGLSFKLSSATLFSDRIPLPRDWVYCAGEHTITVIGDDEARD